MLRKILISILTVFVMSPLFFSQVHHKMKASQKVEELKKIKLIEILEMDEQTSLKFFSRRSEHMKHLELLTEAGRLKMEQIENLLRDKNEVDLKKTIDEYLQIHQSQLNERQNFFKSVNEVLSIQQMARLIVFEEQFRNQLSGLLFRERSKKMRDK